MKLTLQFINAFAWPLVIYLFWVSISRLQIKMTKNIMPDQEYESSNTFLSLGKPLDLLTDESFFFFRLPTPGWRLKFRYQK